MMKRLAIAAVLAQAALALAAQPRGGDAPAPGKQSGVFEKAARNRRLVAKYGDSCATVRYYTKKDAEGREPSFKVPYQCPNCSDTHWRNSGVSAENGVPGEFAGFLVAPDRVLMQDLYIAPEYVDRIEVECAGETISAAEFLRCPDNGAVVLKTDKPFSKGRPLAFTAKGRPADPQYFFVATEPAGRVCGVKGGGAASFRHFAETGRDIYKVAPNTLVLDGKGNAVTVAFQETVFMGEETFTPPDKWRTEPAGARAARDAETKKRIARAVLPAVIQLESEHKTRSRRMSILLDSDESSGNDIDTLLVLMEDSAFLAANLKPGQTERISKMEATLPDGKKAALEFAGSMREQGAIAVKFAGGRPAGIEPFKVYRSGTRALFGRTVKCASCSLAGDKIDVRLGEGEVWGFSRDRKGRLETKLDRGRGPASETDRGEGPAALLGMTGDGLLFSASFPEREKASRFSDGMKSYEGEWLAAMVDKPEFDPENVPRDGKDRKRTPWLGVEAQPAGREIARQKGALQYLGSRAENAPLVTEVAPGSPAARLGVKTGDILLSVRRRGSERATRLRVEPDRTAALDWNEAFAHEAFIEVANTGEITPWPNVESGVNSSLPEFGIGTEVSVAWVSGGVRREGAVRLDAAPVHFANAPRSRSKALGMTVADMTYEVRKYYKFAPGAPGVVVAKVQPGGVAAIAGVRPLELVLQVDGADVVSAKDFVEKTKGRKEFTLTVQRLTTTRVVPVKM